MSVKKKVKRLNREVERLNEEIKELNMDIKNLNTDLELRENLLSFAVYSHLGGLKNGVLIEDKYVNSMNDTTKININYDYINKGYDITIRSKKKGVKNENI